MYTCDAFGSHYCTEDVFDSNLEAVLPHYRFYYECLMKPNAVLCSLLCASALPRRRTSWVSATVMDLYFDSTWTSSWGYKRWSEDALEKAKAKTAVFYTSDYGFSDRLSQSIARGLTKADVEVEMMDMNTADTQELVEAVGGAAGIVILAPPTQGPASDALAAIVGSCKSKQKLLIASLTVARTSPWIPWR